MYGQRKQATATVIAVTSCGTSVGFLLGPALVTRSSSLPTLLYTGVALAAVPFLCCVWHYPALPKVPPSAAAAAVVAVAEASSEGPGSETKHAERQVSPDVSFKK